MALPAAPGKGRAPEPGISVLLATQSRPPARPGREGCKAGGFEYYPGLSPTPTARIREFAGLPADLRPAATPRGTALRQSGRSSGVEHDLAKVGVEGSNPFARSNSTHCDDFCLGAAAAPELSVPAARGNVHQNDAIRRDLGGRPGGRRSALFAPRHSSCFVDRAAARNRPQFQRAFMDISKIPTGQNPPDDVNAIIEIPQGGLPIKYEMDKDSGALFVDRFLHTSMQYPANYGFVPHTLSEDGDPCDILVVSQTPVVPGAVIRCRPIAALMMTDEAGPDEKIIAVPVDALHPFYRGVRSHLDLPLILRDQIAHFFQHYKDLEKDKWVTIVEWVGVDEAKALIVAGLQRAADKK